MSVPFAFHAAAIARALGGKSVAGGYLCRCPVPGHGNGKGDRSPSLFIKDGDRALLVHCFAGCDPRDVLDELRHRGLVEERSTPRSPAPTRPLPAEHKPDPAALEIWVATKPAAGSVVEDYLRSRGITIPVPPSLRCGSRIHLDRFPMPTMVAAVQRPDGKIIAVQTLLLTITGRKAMASTPRITTGALGNGAVRLAKAGDVLGIAEGIETALSAMQLTGVPMWASLGASRMHRVTIPDSVRELHLFSDNDTPGRDAVERTAHENRHRRVVLRYPPEDCTDWNDALIAHGRAAA